MFRVLEFANEPNYKYYVDEEKGVVVCKMIDAEKEARPFKNKLIDICERVSDHKNSDCFHLFSIFPERKMKSFSGKAKCVENDEFNLSFGMKVAKKKCLKKYYKALLNDYIEYNNALEEILDEVEDKIIVFAEKYQRFEKNPYPDK